MMTKDEAPLGLFGLSITISLVIHLLVFWVSSWHFNHSKAIVEPSLHEKPVQWVNLQEQFQNSKIVDIENPKNVTEKKVTSKYLSDQNRNASKNQIASPSESISKQHDSTTQPSSTPGLNLSEEKLTSILSKTDVTPTVLFNPNNYLPEIQVGDETMLSTQRFAYATYFNRMKRAIQVYWHPPVSLIDHNRNKKTWISTMLIILNAQGELVEQQIISSSGAGPLDDYALQAVAKAAPFYNPPEVLLDDAKQIRMNWSFIFEASRF